MALRPVWSKHDVRWVAARASDTAELLAEATVTWASELRPNDPLAIARATGSAFTDLRRDRPALLLSAGTGVAVPYFVAARALGIPSWWLQTLNVVADDGLASRVCSRLATRVLVQQPQLLAAHRRSAFVGELY
jgi:UDP-N-acetylglucosamine:LPS N-acetylglucosamine transferase